jgi:DNA-binding IclR family transcriptional regulator
MLLFVFEGKGMRALSDDRAETTKVQSGIVGSIVHALRILRFLARSAQSHGVTAIAREVGISPSSAFNIVKTLVAEGFLHFDAKHKRYSLGPGALELAGRVLDDQRAYDLMRDSLENLAFQVDVTSAFWKLTSDARLMLLGYVEGRALMRIQMTIGQRLPALSGAMGRCYAAKMQLSQDELLAQFQAVRWQKLPDFEVYKLEVELTKTRGWAIDSDNFIRGVTTVAAAITDLKGQPKFFIANSSFAGLHTQKILEKLGESTRDVALAASHRLFNSARADK